MFTSSSTIARHGAALALTVLLAACGSHHAGPPPVQPGDPGGAVGPFYDFIPIGLPDSDGDVTRRGIANGGIVAGSSWGGPGGTARAFLYDGKKTIELGTLGGTFSLALAVNACGHVAGWSARADGAAHAFLYDDSMRDLGTLGGGQSQGNAISACGKITGRAALAGGQTHAFYYDGKTMRDLGSFGGDSSGLAINTVGQIVGYAYGPGNAWFHAFLYDSRSEAPIQDLGSPGSSSVAVDINDAGQVTGRWRSGDGPVRAFVYAAGVMRDIGTLGGSHAQAKAINAAGLVIGDSTLADGALRGFVYDGTAMTSIGTLAGGNYSSAEAINANGLVVGAATAGTAKHAVAWTRKDGLIDLNAHLHEPPPGIVLVRALAVADDGNIVVRTNTGLALLRERK